MRTIVVLRTDSVTRFFVVPIVRRGGGGGGHYTLTFTPCLRRPTTPPGRNVQCCNTSCLATHPFARVVWRTLVRLLFGEPPLGETSFCVSMSYKKRAGYAGPLTRQQDDHGGFVNAHERLYSNLRTAAAFVRALRLVQLARCTAVTVQHRQRSPVLRRILSRA